MPKLRMKKVAAAFLILIVGRVAYSKDEKPLTYQQAFDKALAKVNDDIGIYARLSCTATSFQFVSDTLKADLANFSTIFAKVPNDKEFIKNTEIGLGVNAFAGYIMQRQAKNCTPNSEDPLRPYNMPQPQTPSQPPPPPEPPAPNHFPPPIQPH
jgi:hypothetical protein